MSLLTSEGTEYHLPLSLKLQQVWHFLDFRASYGRALCSGIVNESAPVGVERLQRRCAVARLARRARGSRHVRQGAASSILHETAQLELRLHTPLCLQTCCAMRPPYCAVALAFPRPSSVPSSGSHSILPGRTVASARSIALLYFNKNL